jgi:hypothetical protein
MAGSLSVSQAALDAFRAESPRIIAETASRALARTEEVAHHGAEASRLITSGIEFTVRMLDAAMAADESALLEDELRWSLDRLPHDGVSTEHVLSRLALLREIVKGRMTPALAAEIAEVIEWTERRLRELAAARNGWLFPDTT